MPHAQTSRRNSPRLSRIVLALAAVLLVASATARAAVDCASPVFSLPQTYGVGAGPAAVATGDFNGDGRQDLAVPNNVSNNVSILLGDGAGGFGPPSNFAVAQLPWSVAVADFNKDGKADLAVGHSFGGGPVSVLFGDGTGRFSTPVVFSTGGPTNVAVGDFNGDTNPDIAVGVINGSPRVLLGDGAGGFNAKPFSVGSDSRFVVAGDFNGDQFKDLAYSVDNVLDEVVIVLGNASGNFVGGTRVALDQSPRAMIARDLNGDSRDDLAITVQHSEPKLEVLINDGTGNFGAPSNAQIASEPNGLTAADFNNDGKVDIAVGNGGGDITFGNGSAQIFFGNGAGAFSTNTERYLTGGAVLLAGDFDNDGKADLVSPRPEVGVTPGVVAVVKGRGDGTFEVSRSRSLGNFNTFPSAFAVTDLNGDGVSDVASTFSFSTSVNLILGDGAGGLGQPVFLNTPSNGGAVAAGDFDGDGKRDVAVVNVGAGFGTTTVFYGDGAGSAARTVDVSAAVFLLAAGNFDGNNRTDLVALDGVGKVYIFLSTGPSGFAAAPGSPFTSTAPVVVGDFNGDGRDDLANGDPTQNRVSIFLNDGAGRMTLTSTATIPIGTNFHELHLAVGDFNRDGRADLVSANGDARNVTLFLGDGAGGLGSGTNFASTTRGSLTTTTTFLEVADFDGDTNPDLAVLHRSSTFGGDLSVLFGDGAGGFSAPLMHSAGNPYAFAVGNFNADTKPDLAVLGMAANSVTVLQNIHEPLPCLSVGDATLTEGDSGSRNADFTVTLSEASARTVRVNYSLKGLTATEVADYAVTSGRLVFAPGETSKTVSVPVAGDALDEADETFELRLTSPTHAGISDGVGLGTINDNDPTPTLSADDISVIEGTPGGFGFGTTATFKIQLSAPSGRDVTVHYATAPGTATQSTVSVTHDYQGAEFTATIPAGQTSVNVSVFVSRDNMHEADETFFLDLSEPVNATIADARAQCTIVNDDPVPTLLTNPAFWGEGDAGQSALTFTLNLSHASYQPVSVNFSTADGTAVAPGDYAPTTGTVTFAPEETTKTFTVMVNGDTVDELDESFNVNFSNPVNMTLPALAKTNGIIIDDDGPAISIDDVTVVEGFDGTTNAVFTVTLSAPSVQPVEVSFSTADGTAVFGEDYQRRSFNFIEFAPGTTSATITVRVFPDTKIEPDETFTVNLFEPFGATIADAQGTCTILDDDEPHLQVSAQSYAAGEGDGKVLVTVTRTGTANALTVDYATAPGTASDRSDYTTALGTLHFGNGETQKTVAVLLTDDALAEGPEALSFTLSNPSLGKLRAPSSAVLTINDNDAASGPSPVRDDAFNTEFFVRQHYADFLNREPDASGLEFWKNEIEECGQNAQCREVKKVNVSAAFFLSIEFQQTGYYVYRLHQASFATGERLPFNAFLRDAQEVGRDVVVGAEGWELKLEANRQAFADAFAARAAFAARYPASLTPEQFVDALNVNTGGALTQVERDQLVADLKSGAKTRAQVLRAVADNTEFQRRQSSRAFVLMQYFGYLRRAPDSPPDADFVGYNFWLGKLNEFNGNFIEAEMVKAFVTSIEYKQRFGQP
ncbi:MAG TPA: Calx-beta domain-containing protein [Pyrinomonadaceae bacterium]